MDVNNTPQIEPEYDGRDGRAVTATIGDDGIELTFDYGMPKTDTLTLPVAEKAINQYALIDKRGTSRSGTASSKSHHDRVHVLIRDGDEWTYVNPVPRARPYKSDSDSEYVPTQVNGLEMKTEFKRSGGRGHESGYHKRAKATRELVEAHDEVFLIEFREEKGGSQNGSYHRFKNAQARRLVADSR